MTAVCKTTDRLGERGSDSQFAERDGISVGEKLV